jgi:putative transposase
MLFWTLLASGQIRMRKVDGWQSLAKPITSQPVALVA